MSLERQIKELRATLAIPDVDPVALNERLTAFFEREYQEASPEERARIDARRAAAEEERARDPEGHDARVFAELNAAIVAYRADCERDGVPCGFAPEGLRPRKGPR